jgi:uncharacterized protein YggT (Ycf19 family)
VRRDATTARVGRRDGFGAGSFDARRELRSRMSACCGDCVGTRPSAFVHWLRASSSARASQVVDYLFYLVYGIIGLEIVLNAIGARQSAGFKQLIDAIATPFLAPFRGLMPTPGVGSFRLTLSYIVALAVYMLLHMAVNGLFRLIVHRKTVV